jgi:hypothetical protein
MGRARSTTYEIRTSFRAPLPFVFAWCTDYAPDDHVVEGASAPRKLLRPVHGRIRYEDLDETLDGWMWSRWEVTLHPPDRWHGDAIGNYRGWSIDYSLRELPDGRTEFRLKGRRWPLNLGTRNPPKARQERALLHMWKEFGRALEADYQRSLRPRGARDG